jgi:hypothetical protein
MNSDRDVTAGGERTNQSTKCSLKKRCVKSVLGPKTPLKNPVHRKPGFKISAIKFHVCSVSKKRTSTHECEYFTEVQGMNA